MVCVGDKARILQTIKVKPTRAQKDLVVNAARNACANLAPKPVVTVDAAIDFINKPSPLVRHARHYVVVVAVVFRRRTKSYRASREHVADLPRWEIPFLEDTCKFGMCITFVLCVLGIPGTGSACVLSVPKDPIDVDLCP